MEKPFLLFCNKEINILIQNSQTGKNLKDYLVQAQLENLRPGEVKSFTQVHRRNHQLDWNENHLSTPQMCVIHSRCSIIVPKLISYSSGVLFSSHTHILCCWKAQGLSLCVKAHPHPFPATFLFLRGSPEVEESEEQEARQNSFFTCLKGSSCFSHRQREALHKTFRVSKWTLVQDHRHVNFFLPRPCAAFPTHQRSPNQWQTDGKPVRV